MLYFGQNWWLGNYFSFLESLFSGASCYFQGFVHFNSSFNDHVQLHFTFFCLSGSIFFPYFHTTSSSSRFQNRIPGFGHFFGVFFCQCFHYFQRGQITSFKHQVSQGMLPEATSPGSLEEIFWKIQNLSFEIWILLNLNVFNWIFLAYLVNIPMSIHWSFIEYSMFNEYLTSYL